VIVIDASVLAEALTGSGRTAEAARAALSDDARWAGPPLLKTETLSVVRGRLLGKKITQEVADAAVADLLAVVVDTVDEDCLLPRMWELRGDLTSYDAAYVAAAEALGCPLVTLDVKLSRAIGPRCPVQVVAP
jgi:predicted nucleic acid-binding protein